MLTVSWDKARIIKKSHLDWASSCAQSHHPPCWKAMVQRGWVSQYKIDWLRMSWNKMPEYPKSRKSFPKHITQVYTVDFWYATLRYAASFMHWKAPWQIVIWWWLDLFLSPSRNSTIYAWGIASVSSSRLVFHTCLVTFPICLTSHHTLKQAPSCHPHIAAKFPPERVKRSSAIYVFVLAGKANCVSTGDLFRATPHWSWRRPTSS